MSTNPRVCGGKQKTTTPFGEKSVIARTSQLVQRERVRWRSINNRRLPKTKKNHQSQRGLQHRHGRKGIKPVILAKKGAQSFLLGLAASARGTGSWTATAELIENL